MTYLSQLPETINPESFESSAQTLCLWPIRVCAGCLDSVSAVDQRVIVDDCEPMTTYAGA